MLVSKSKLNYCIVHISTQMHIAGTSQYVAQSGNHKHITFLGWLAQFHNPFTFLSQQKALNF